MPLQCCWVLIILNFLKKISLQIFSKISLKCSDYFLFWLCEYFKATLTSVPFWSPWKGFLMFSKGWKENIENKRVKKSLSFCVTFSELFVNYYQRKVKSVFYIFSDLWNSAVNWSRKSKEHHLHYQKTNKAATATWICDVPFKYFRLRTVLFMIC